MAMSVGKPVECGKLRLSKNNKFSSAELSKCGLVYRQLGAAALARDKQTVGEFEQVIAKGQEEFRMILAGYNQCFRDIESKRLKFLDTFTLGKASKNASLKCIQLGRKYTAKVNRKMKASGSRLQFEFCLEFFYENSKVENYEAPFCIRVLYNPIKKMNGV